MDGAGTTASSVAVDLHTDASELLEALPVPILVTDRSNVGRHVYSLRDPCRARDTRAELRRPTGISSSTYRSARFHRSGWETTGRSVVHLAKMGYVAYTRQRRSKSPSDGARYRRKKPESFPK